MPSCRCVATRTYVCSLLVVVCVLVGFARPGTAAFSLPDEDWQFDLIHTRGGKVYKGLLVAETPEYVKFWRIIRSPGHPTPHVLSYKQRTSRIDRLNVEQRPP